MTTPTPTNRRAQFESWWTLLRDIASFSLGVAGFLWQMVVEPTPEPTILAASVALIGLPVASKVQRKVRQPPNEEE